MAMTGCLCLPYYFTILESRNTDVISVLRWVILFSASNQKINSCLHIYSIVDPSAFQFQIQPPPPSTCTRSRLSRSTYKYSDDIEKICTIKCKNTGIFIKLSDLTFTGN